MRKTDLKEIFYFIKHLITSLCGWALPRSLISYIFYILSLQFTLTLSLNTQSELFEPGEVLFRIALD